MTLRQYKVIQLLSIKPKLQIQIFSTIKQFFIRLFCFSYTHTHTQILLYNIASHCLHRSPGVFQMSVRPLWLLSPFVCSTFHLLLPCLVSKLYLILEIRYSCILHICPFSSHPHTLWIISSTLYVVSWCFKSLIYINTHLGFPGGSDGKESSPKAGDLGLIHGFDPWVGESLEKGILTHFNILAWRIP